MSEFIQLYIKVLNNVVSNDHKFGMFMVECECARRRPLQ